MAIPAHKTEYFIIENSILQKKANTAQSYIAKNKGETLPIVVEVSKALESII